MCVRARARVAERDSKERHSKEEKSKRKDEDVSKAWALAHQGKATSDVDYNPEDPPSAYNNATVHSCLNEYTSMAREVHGPEYDPSTQDLDAEIIMRVGEGKKHGRCWIGDSTLDTASTPTTSQIRARSTSSSPAIRSRPDTAQTQMKALRARMEADFKAQQDEMAARWQAEWERMEQEFQRRHEAELQKLEQALQYVHSMAAAMGFSLPPFTPPAPPPRLATPNQSAASNDGPVNPKMSPPPPP